MDILPAIEKLIEEINEERKRQGLSIKELAERANIPKSTVEKILFKITKHPRIDTLQALRSALGLSNEEPEYTEDEKELFELIGQLTDEEAQEMWSFLEYLISKRQKK